MDRLELRAVAVWATETADDPACAPVELSETKDKLPSKFYCRPEKPMNRSRREDRDLKSSCCSCSGSGSDALGSSVADALTRGMPSRLGPTFRCALQLCSICLAIGGESGERQRDQDIKRILGRIAAVSCERSKLLLLMLMRSMPYTGARRMPRCVLCGARCYLGRIRVICMSDAV
jgi:hypothetical protein